MVPYYGVSRLACPVTMRYYTRDSRPPPHNSTIHNSQFASTMNRNSLNRSLLQASRGSIVFFSIILFSWANLSLCLFVHRTCRRTAITRSHFRPHSFFEFDGRRTRTDEETDSAPLEDSRRSFVRGGFITLSTAISGSTLFVCKASARGLVRFPCKEQPLLNTYHFMRAGSSLLEVEDVWSTNPLFLTNREAALSEKGEGEVRRACNQLKAMGITPTIVRYSLAASSIDAANIVGEEFNIGQDRLVPEFNYMDPRAIGGKFSSPQCVSVPYLLSL
jgi:hypothetical protein